MSIAKCKLRGMSFKLIENKEEFDSILGDKHDVGDKKQIEKQGNDDKIIPRYGYVTTSQLIHTARQFSSNSSSITDHGYIRTITPNAAYSINYEFAMINKQLISTIRKKIPTILFQPPMIHVIKQSIQTYLTLKFKQSNFSSLSSQISLFYEFINSHQLILNETIKKQIRDILVDIYNHWRRQTSQIDNFIDKTANVGNKSFTAMAEFQRPFKPRLKARFNCQLNFLQTTGINQNNSSTSNLIETYHSIRKELQNQKLQSESFLNKFLYLGKKFGFQIPSQLLSNHFRQSNHNRSLDEEITIGSNQAEQKFKDVLGNLSQLIIPKQNIFSYLNVSYKRKTRVNTKKRVIKIGNFQKSIITKGNKTKKDQYNSSFSTCYQHSRDYEIYDSQQQEKAA